MKPYFLLFCLSLSLVGLLSAQNTAGVIRYEEKVNMHRNLPEDAGDMRAMIPEFQTMQSELLFSTSESLYRSVEEDEEEDEFGGNGVMIRMKRPDMQIYKSFSSSQKVELREFMGKNYLLEDSIEQTPWKVGMETREILGYNCMQATWADTTGERKRNITAWFAPDIPVSAGPAGYGALPGMILAIDVNDGSMLLTAQSVSLKAPKKGELEAPSKGEKTTEAEYQKMVEERMRAMGGSGGRGVRIIRN